MWPGLLSSVEDYECEKGVFAPKQCAMPAIGAAFTRSCVSREKPKPAAPDSTATTPMPMSATPSTVHAPATVWVERSSYAVHPVPITTATPQPFQTADPDPPQRHVADIAQSIPADPADNDWR